jgi:hypothetical protein
VFSACTVVCVSGDEAQAQEIGSFIIVKKPPDIASQGEAIFLILDGRKPAIALKRPFPSSKAAHYTNVLNERSREKVTSASAPKTCRKARDPRRTVS